jgi:predicted histone-like DNA-binding protein
MYNVKYNVIGRANPQDRAAPKKYYPSIIANGRTTDDELAQEAADRSTLTSADLMAALENFKTLIPDELARGNIVDLGNFGSFWLSAATKGSDTPEEVTPDNITGLTVNFRPGKEFKSVLAKVKFEHSLLPLPEVPEEENQPA